MAAVIKARPTTPPTTPPIIAPFFCEPELPPEPKGTAVDEAPLPEVLTVTVVVMMPFVLVKVETAPVELSLLPDIEVATILPESALAAHPIKLAPYKES
jgi:hypothetical protein